MICTPGRAHGEVFRGIDPAATMVEVSRFIDPRILVEIEAYAVIAEPQTRAPRSDDVD